MNYPVLEIDLKKLQDNARVMAEYFRKKGIEIMAVNKVFNGMTETAEAVYEGGLKVVAESIPANLKKLKALPCEKAFLRSPGPSEIKEVVAYADLTLASELWALEALSEEALRQGKVHKILLMVDMGDLREGIWFEDEDGIAAATAKILESPGLSLYGLGTNFGCYGTVLPTESNAKAFVALAGRIETRLGIKFPYLSGGNCISFYLVDAEKMPKEINHLRIGGQHLFGMDYVEGRYLEGYHHSNMPIDKCLSNLYILKAEIIELRSKPTVPVGDLWVDAFMQVKTFEDRGIRRQALLALGRQEVPFENIAPVDRSIKILGQTGNHTIIDVEGGKENYKVGDIISFEVDYTALLFLCNSQSVEKIAVRHCIAKSPNFRERK